MVSSERKALNTPTSVDTQKPIKNLYVLKYTGRILVTYKDHDFGEVYDPETFNCIEKIASIGTFKSIHELPDKRICFSGTEDETTEVYKLAYDSRKSEHKLENTSNQHDERDSDNESELEFEIFDSNDTDILELDEAPNCEKGGSYISGGLFLADTNTFQKKEVIVPEIKLDNEIILTAVIRENQIIVGRRDGRIEIYKKIKSAFECIHLNQIPLDDNCFLHPMQIIVLPSGNIIVNCKIHDDNDFFLTKNSLYIFDASLESCQSIKGDQLPSLFAPFLLLHDGRTLLSFLKDSNLIFRLDTQTAQINVLEIHSEISALALTKNNLLLLARENTIEMVEAEEFIADKKPIIAATTSQFLPLPLVRLIIDYGCLWKELKSTPKVTTQNSLSPKNQI